MVFDWGMGELVTSRTLRADDYSLSEEAKRLRDAEQQRMCDAAYDEALRLLSTHRAVLDRFAERLLECETLDRRDVDELLVDVAPESSHALEIGRILAVPWRPGQPRNG
jgi:ATP-dependent Zn protease